VCNTAGYQTSTTDGVYVDGKCWKATVVCNGTTRELTARQSCFLAIVLAAVIHCNVVDMSDGGRHLAQHSYCHGRKGRPRSTPGVTRS